MYSTLLVLKDYEDLEFYEECAIIRDALKKYKQKYESKFPKNLKFPMHLSMYNDNAFQKIMEKLNMTVEEKKAKEKAALIKLKLPITSGF